jgi:hypothetical protein
VPSLQCPLRYDGAMRLALDPFRFLLISLAGWLNQQQQDVIDYLQEENRVLREQRGGKRLRFSDNQRRRLAVRAKKLGWRVLQELTTIVTPATLMVWHRRLIAQRESSMPAPCRDRRGIDHGWSRLNGWFSSTASGK